MLKKLSFSEEVIKTANLRIDINRIVLQITPITDANYEYYVLSFYINTRAITLDGYSKANKSLEHIQTFDDSNMLKSSYIDVNTDKDGLVYTELITDRTVVSVLVDGGFWVYKTCYNGKWVFKITDLNNAGVSNFTTRIYYTYI